MFKELNKYTSATIFLLRAVGIDFTALSNLGFINAYISDKNHEPKYDGVLYVLFKPDSNGEFQEFLENELQRGASIIEDYDYEGGYVVLVYSLPEKFEEDYQKIVDGKFSKLSDDFKKLFPMKTEKGTKHSIYYHIFNKTEPLRKKWEEILDASLDDDMEFWFISSEEKETLDIKKLQDGDNKQILL